MRDSLSNEADQAINSLVNNPEHAKPTMKTATLREILLYSDGWLTTRGRMMDIKSKSLGAGVYKVWLEDQEPPTS